MRLSVYLAAPRAAIADIVARHPMLADLINQDWLYVLQWDQASQTIARYYRGQWLPQPTLTAASSAPEEAPCTA